MKIIYFIVDTLRQADVYSHYGNAARMNKMRQNTYAVKISYNTVKGDGDETEILVKCDNQFIAEEHVVDKIRTQLQADGDNLMSDYKTTVYEYARG